MRLGALGLLVALEACVVHDPPVNAGYAYPYGYGYGYGLAPGYGEGDVGTPTPYEVSTEAPEPLDEQMTQSPGDGYDWIDGYWHWNGYDWVWVGGRWEREQDGYVYVPPNYDYGGRSFVYTPGYWAPRNHIPLGWRYRAGANGHPATVVPPASWHNPGYPVHPARPSGPPSVVGGVRAPAPVGVGGYRELPQQPVIQTRDGQGGRDGEREPAPIYDRDPRTEPATGERPSEPAAGYRPAEPAAGYRPAATARPATEPAHAAPVSRPAATGSHRR